MLSPAPSYSNWTTATIELSANRAKRCSTLRRKFQDPWRRSLAAACAFCLSQLWRLRTWMFVPAPNSSAESSVNARVGKLSNRQHPCSPFRSGHTALDVVAKNKSVIFNNLKAPGRGLPQPSWTYHRCFCMALYCFSYTLRYHQAWHILLFINRISVAGIDYAKYIL